MQGMTLATPPVAAKKPHSFTHHGITVSDPYAWLRDPGYPEVKDDAVLAHLNAENAWFEARMAERQPVIDKLFREMRGRIKEADRSVPQKDGDFLYWIEFEDGAVRFCVFCFCGLVLWDFSGVRSVRFICTCLMD